MERIKDAVCRAYDVEKYPLLLLKRVVFNGPRDMGIYFVRRFRGEKLREIGREFNMDNYSLVRSATQRIKKEISENL